MKPARAAREAAGISTREACRAARISLSTLRKVECGLPASYRVMQVLAALYGRRQDGLPADYAFRRHTEGGREMSTRKPARRGPGPAAREGR